MALDITIRNQLQDYMARLVSPIKLLANVDESASSQEMLGMLEEVTSLSEKITLNKFLTLLEKEKNSRFKARKANEKVQFFNDHWINHYYLEIERNKQITIVEIKQKVYFSENLKSFGENQKEVWSVYLGEME